MIHKKGLIMSKVCLNKEFNEFNDGFNGCIKAHVVETKDSSVNSWLDLHCNAADMAPLLSQRSKMLLIIDNIEVEAGCQGMGYGSSILKSTIAQSGCDSAVLVCDLGEIQRLNFELIEFYKKHGFGVVTNNEWQALMVYPATLAYDLFHKYSFDDCAYAA
jgi:hypothetical protein